MSTLSAFISTTQNSKLSKELPTLKRNGRILEGFSERIRLEYTPGGGGGGGALLGSIFAGYVPLASQSPYPIIVYSVANYRPHLSHF